MRLPHRAHPAEGASLLKRSALGALGVCVALVLTGLLVPGAAGGWSLVIGSFGTPAPLMLLGIRRDAAGPLVGIFAALAVVLVGAGLGMLELSGTLGPWVLGLPLGAAVQVYLACAAPLLVLPLVYAHFFDSQTLSVEDLDRLRRDAPGGPMKS